jgi:quinol monooxygenase YgiN
LTPSPYLDDSFRYHDQQRAKTQRNKETHGSSTDCHKSRCEDIVKEPGCEQFEVFQSVVNPDHLVILERWTDQAALDVHSKVNATRAPIPGELRVGITEREDYTYNRTR